MAKTWIKLTCPIAPTFPVRACWRCARGSRRKRSNCGGGRTADNVHVTVTVDAAAWAAELRVGEGAGRIYLVKPTGALEVDPNMTDKKFPGNPTRSYRTRGR